MAGRGRSGDLLGSLLRASIRVREAVVETGKQGKMQLDLTLLRRRRRELLAELGAVVERLAQNGRMDEDAFPELGAPLSRLESIDQEIAAAERKLRGDVDDEPREAPDEDDDEEEYDR